MKKFSALFMIILIITACFTACNSSTNSSSSAMPTSAEEATESSIDFDELSLVSAYCNGDWDGTFISNDEHCASIIDGSLWIDCQTAEQIPDMGIYEDCFWFTVISSDKEGTWVYDKQLGTVDYWSKGIRIHKIVVNSEKPFMTSVYVLSDCIVARNDENISLYDFNGYNITNIRDVIDLYSSDGDGKITYSNFEHQNFSIDGVGNVSELDTHYVRFPRRNVQLEENPKASTAYFNLFWGTTWEGEFQKIGNDFVYVDYSGDIYVNNELIGNVNLPINQLINSFGSNILTGKDESLYLDGKNLIVYKKADEKIIDVPDGPAKFIWSNYEYGTVIMVYGSSENDNTLVIVKDDKVKVISESVSDANVAYDTLYYMEGDKVYRMSWEETDAKPSLFIEGAYAVSRHTDELEGAIVPSELNNMEAYGEYNLYSPYGK